MARPRRPSTDTLSRISLALLLAFSLSPATAATPPPPAGPRLAVLALFPNQSVIEIDGQPRLLRAGQRSPEGIRLVRADARQAVIEVGGRMRTLEPGMGALRPSPAPRSARAGGHRLALLPNDSGMYLTMGSINGLPVEFVVDTGAAVVAIDTRMARRLGIDYEREGRPVVARTAAGDVHAFQVKLDFVRVGGLVVRDVDAAVVQRDRDAPALLGMSFLGRLALEKTGSRLVLSEPGRLP